MCLAVPCKVISINGDYARIDHGGNTMNVDISMVPDVSVGQYVVVHAGMAIEKYDEEEAMETLRLLKQYFNQEENPDP
jgi:hydrogenase expression/formation protein HypC